MMKEKRQMHKYMKKKLVCIYFLDCYDLRHVIFSSIKHVISEAQMCHSNWLCGFGGLHMQNKLTNATQVIEKVKRLLLLQVS